MIVAFVLAVIVALTLAMVYVLVTTARAARADDERRVRHGIDATATITSVHAHTGGESECLRSLHLELALVDGRRFEVTRTIELRGPEEPAVGDALRVRCHPDRPRDFRIVGGPFADD